jgi:hypothetical protein
MLDRKKGVLTLCDVFIHEVPHRAQFFIIYHILIKKLDIKLQFTDQDGIMNVIWETDGTCLWNSEKILLEKYREGLQIIWSSGRHFPEERISLFNLNYDQETVPFLKRIHGTFFEKDWTVFFQGLLNRFIDNNPRILFEQPAWLNLFCYPKERIVPFMRHVVLSLDPCHRPVIMNLCFKMNLAKQIILSELLKKEIKISMTDDKDMFTIVSELLRRLPYVSNPFDKKDIKGFQKENIERDFIILDNGVIHGKRGSKTKNTLVKHELSYILIPCPHRAFVVIVSLLLAKQFQTVVSVKTQVFKHIQHILQK